MAQLRRSIDVKIHINLYNLILTQDGHFFLLFFFIVAFKIIYRVEVQENFMGSILFCFFFEFVKRIRHKKLRLWSMSDRKAIKGIGSIELNIFFL